MHAATSYSSGSRCDIEIIQFIAFECRVFFVCIVCVCMSYVCSLLCHLLHIIAIKTILTNSKIDFKLHSCLSLVLYWSGFCLNCTTHMRRKYRSTETEAHLWLGQVSIYGQTTRVVLSATCTATNYTQYASERTRSVNPCNPSAHTLNLTLYAKHIHSYMVWHNQNQDALVQKA